MKPAREIARKMAVLLSLLPGYLIGIQARVGAISGDGAVVRFPQSSALMRYVDCSYAHVPARLRRRGGEGLEGPLSFFVASDSLEARRVIVQRIAEYEGGVVASFGATPLGWADTAGFQQPLLNASSQWVRDCEK